MCCFSKFTLNISVYFFPLIDVLVRLCSLNAYNFYVPKSLHKKKLVALKHLSALGTRNHFFPDRNFSLCKGMLIIYSIYKHNYEFLKSYISFSKAYLQF